MIYHLGKYLLFVYSYINYELSLNSLDFLMNIILLIRITLIEFINIINTENPKMIYINATAKRIQATTIVNQNFSSKQRRPTL